MEGWSEICKEQGQPEYRFQPQEVRELTGFTYTMRLKEIDELLAEAEMWMVETDGEKTLLQFLYEIQEKPMPEPEVEWPSPAKQDTGLDLEDAFFAEDTEKPALKRRTRVRKRKPRLPCLTPGAST